MHRRLERSRDDRASHSRPRRLPPRMESRHTMRRLGQGLQNLAP